MGSHGYEHRGPGLHRYPCARLRIWPRETVSAVPSRYRTDFIYTRHYRLLEGTRNRPCALLAPREPPLDRMPAEYTQCRVRKQSNECESGKRFVKSQRSGVALTEYGARGALAGRALPTSTACGRKTVLPPRDYINSFAFTICSPSREHASIIFFGPELGLYQFVRLHNSFAVTRIVYFFRAGA